MTSDPALPAETSYDFAVIGGGSAGYAAARTASSLGLKTVVVEGGKDVGGLCILRGCMPTKTMIESANRFMTLRRASEFGLRAENLRVIEPEILERKRRLVAEFAGYRQGQLEKGNFDFIRGRARFLDAHHLEIEPLGGGPAQQRLQIRSGLIATGSVISALPIPGLEEAGYLTSDDILELSRLPASVVILGAGAVGLEASHHLAGLGVQVTVIQRGAHVLRDADTDVADALEKALADTHGIRFHCGSQLRRVERDAATGQKRVWFERAGEEHSAAAEEVVYALGRRPSTTGLDLLAAGVELTKSGGVCTGADQRTTCSHLFAAGDVCGPYEIVHMAIQQAEIAARNAARHLGKLTGAAEEMDYRLKLFALFTQPQMAGVGMTMREAFEAGIECDEASYLFADHGKAMVRGETEGFVKLIARCGTGEILGAAAVGPEAAELIHEIVVAMYFRATAADLAAIPHYHPTLSEIWTYPAEDLAHLTGKSPAQD